MYSLIFTFLKCHRNRFILCFFEYRFPTLNIAIYEMLESWDTVEALFDSTSVVDDEFVNSTRKYGQCVVSL